MTRLWAGVLAVMASAAVLAAQGVGPAREAIDGIENFTAVDATIACAGATEARAIPVLAERGYKAIINLRQASEEGAAIEESRAAAKSAGIRFIHLPLNSREPETATADAFMAAIADPLNHPAFINCASANRAAALLMIKRLLLDEWPETRALEEARAVGLTSPVLQKFALDYVAANRPY